MYNRHFYCHYYFIFIFIFFQLFKNLFYVVPTSVLLVAEPTVLNCPAIHPRTWRSKYSRKSNMFSFWGFCGIIVFYILDFCFVLESVFQYCFPWKSPIQECIWFGKMIMTSRVHKISFSSSANVRGSVVLHQTMCCSGWLWFWRIFDWLNKNVFSSVGKSQFFS